MTLAATASALAALLDGSIARDLGSGAAAYTAAAASVASATSALAAPRLALDTAIRKVEIVTTGVDGGANPDPSRHSAAKELASRFPNGEAMRAALVDAEQAYLRASGAAQQARAALDSATNSLPQLIAQGQVALAYKNA